MTCRSGCTVTLAVVAGCCVALSMAAGRAVAADTARQPQHQRHVVVELNALADTGTACRATFVIENRLGVPLKKFNFEAVLFGKDQRVMRLVSVAAGAFPAGKTRVRQFDLRGISCGNIGRVLYNLTSACEAEGLAARDCAIVTRSRAGVALNY